MPPVFKPAWQWDGLCFLLCLHDAPHNNRPEAAKMHVYYSQALETTGTPGPP